MLSGAEILERVKSGDIQISNFDSSRINPNSYNLTLNKKLKVYEAGMYMVDKGRGKLLPAQYDVVIDHRKNEIVLDMKKDNLTFDLEIPEEGMILYPGILYLGSTNESTYAKGLVPTIDGRSSIGRLGIQVHYTAGFGDNGFSGTWTLEIQVTHPIKVYPNVEIAQISFHEIQGDQSILYKGKYQGQTDPVESRMYMDRSVK